MSIRFLQLGLVSVLTAGVLAAVPASAADDQRAAREVAAGGPARATAAPVPSVIPAPDRLTVQPGTGFELTERTVVVAHGGAEVRTVAEQLAQALRPATGLALPVVEPGDAPAHRAIALRLEDDLGIGPEGYRLGVTPGGVQLAAPSGTGLFHGFQTLRQLLPAKIEARTVQRGPWLVPGVQVEDDPRFGWRSAMLDPARHFLTVDEVKRYIDLIARYKLNTLHLHLTDDQGWRIEIDSWPRLATHGGSTEVGGGPGGYYTKEDYAEIVEYAAQHHITVVPEIDMPGHTNAALASYAELNCDGVAPPPYTGTSVGFSSLCIDKPITYEFIDDVIREVAAMTPGPYIHIGGDEAHSTDHDDYVRFVEEVERIVRSHGKRMIGWEEISGTGIGSDSIAQYWWDAAEARAAADKGMGVIMSPAQKAYLDMKYDPSTPLGLTWAGYTSVQDGYEFDPGTFAAGLAESAILGVEGPLWGETVEDILDVEFMAFPRIAGLAERGWSEAEGRSWEEYRLRLGAHGPRWDALGVNFFRSPEVPWGQPAAVTVAPAQQVVYAEDGSARLPVTVANRSTAAVTDLRMSVTAADGSAVQPATIAVPRLPAGRERTVEFRVGGGDAAAARSTSVTTAVAWVGYDGVANAISVETPLRLSCATGPTTPEAVTYVDSEELVGEDGAAENAIDGNPDTIWHTRWFGGSDGYPHEIQVDLGAVRSVCAFRYLPRQNGVNGTVRDYEVYLSTDGAAWGEPVVAGSFRAGAAEAWVPVPERTARYVRFRALSEVNGGPWTSAAEIAVDARG